MTTNPKKTWMKNAIIYHILIDRFSGVSSEKNWKEPIFLGGNIKGIIKKIPYLQHLGIDTIWISPFYKTSAYHGYHITDFYEVDPNFGTKEDLQALIDSAHQSNMRIIADFVPNHCSYLHPFFKKAQESKSSPFRNWFYFKRWPDKYLCFLSFKEIPKLKLENKDTMKHIIDAALYWLSFGLDGFRLDHVIGPSHRFWSYFSKKIKTSYPDALLIGEAWMQGIRFHELNTINMKGKYLKWLFGHSSNHLLKSYQGLLDGVLDFHGQQLIKKYGFYRNHNINNIIQILNKHYKKYKNDYVLPLFLDNHDMDRILFICGNNKDLLKRIATIQFSVHQPVIIYYGTEIGMTQQKSIWDCPAHGDIQARQSMQWNHIDEDLLLFYQTLAKKRKTRLF